MFTLIDTMNDNILEALTPKLLGDQPNTYAFSKALSEAVVSKSGIPTGVARPSIGNLIFCTFYSFANGKYISNL